MLKCWSVVNYGIVINFNISGAYPVCCRILDNTGLVAADERLGRLFRQQTRTKVCLL